MGTFAPYQTPGIYIGPEGETIPNGAQPGDFKPEYLCLVYLKFEPDGLVVKHAYFDLPQDLQRFSMDEFYAVGRTGNWATAPYRQEVNFENFTFHSQHVIVFYIDWAGARVRFDRENLVQFAPWLAHGPKTPATRKSQNNSFFNGIIEDWFEREALVLENWFVDENGEAIKPPLGLRYSMNLHLLMRCVLLGAVSDIPLIVDPDTGNMGGGGEGDI